ncbi:MAG TPA: class I SAM-dependent methyltransferase [Myxococcota bacterium]|nr:class I SAM-dependent methyltransferase [Myxococcota bacterium]
MNERSRERPGKSIVFDRAAETYDATRGFPPGVAERVAALVDQAVALGPEARLLEIGVGTGRLALPLAARGLRVTGVDLSRPMMEQLLAKRGDLSVAVARADATLLPFPRGSFDAVLAVHVFHLIPCWREVLREIARVLPSHGVFVHAADDRTADWAQWRDGAFGSSHNVDNVGVPYAQTETFPEQQGWQLVREPYRLAFSRRLKPSRLVDGLLRRDWSWTWGLTDAQLAEAAERLRATLAQRFGGLDSSVEVQSGFWVRVYRAPSGLAPAEHRATT